MINNITQEQAEAIFRKHSAQVYRVALFLTKSPTLADDITQDTFLQVFSKYHTYDPTQPITPWIYKIALNITRKTMRKQKWHIFAREMPDIIINPVEDSVVKQELNEALWQAISKLTLKSKEVIVMHYYSELKLSEIAAVLEIPLGTCKSRLNTALNSLEKQLVGNNIVTANKGEDLYGTV